MVRLSVSLGSYVRSKPRTRGSVIHLIKTLSNASISFFYKKLRNLEKLPPLNTEVNFLFTLIKQTNCALHFVNLFLACPKLY